MADARRVLRTFADDTDDVAQLLQVIDIYDVADEVFVQTTHLPARPPLQSTPDRYLLMVGYVQWLPYLQMARLMQPYCCWYIISAQNYL